MAAHCLQALDCFLMWMPVAVIKAAGNDTKLGLDVPQKLLAIAIFRAMVPCLKDSEVPQLQPLFTLAPQVTR